MGKFDYAGTPQILIDFDAAERMLERHMKIDNLAIYKTHIAFAIKNATLKIARYQNALHINMQKVELLRDVVFVGASLVERGSAGESYYRALVCACFEIVMDFTGAKFEPDFIKKIASSKQIFFKQPHFNAEAFYLLFKSHFRIVAADRLTIS
ncbi:hypothetical protein AGMMS50229_15600 [Campylobacterota bacterium]|nr:hypothetical protein AGMMS50229_15600 [Campylobacterota bacterium]